MGSGSAVRLSAMHFLYRDIASALEVGFTGVISPSFDPLEEAEAIVGFVCFSILGYFSSMGSYASLHPQPQFMALHAVFKNSLSNLG